MIPHLDRLARTVRDEDHGYATPLLYLPHDATHLSTSGQIETGERLIKKNDPRFRRQGPSKRHSLRLATGKATRHPIREM